MTSEILNRPYYANKACKKNENNFFNFQNKYLPIKYKFKFIKSIIITNLLKFEKN